MINWKVIQIGGCLEKINEVIVVEGRDDEINLKKYFDCEVIRTNGFGITKETYKKIKLAYEKRGVIILTDPDYAGKMIRKEISNFLPDVKHAFINQQDATKNGNIGVENASKEVLEDALSKVKLQKKDYKDQFDRSILFKYKLIGVKGAKKRRKLLGDILKIGYCNSKQLIHRLNNYGIKKDEFIKAMKEIDKQNG